MTTLEALEAAKARIDTPEKWEAGNELAAVSSVCGDAGFLYLRCYNALCDACGIRSLIGWLVDPERSHADVMALFARAIAAEKGKVSQ